MDRMTLSEICPMDCINNELSDNLKEKIINILSENNLSISQTRRVCEKNSVNSNLL